MASPGFLRDRLALRIHDGAFSAMDLTARHPRTGELLSTVQFMVQTLAAVGDLQRDLLRELTYDGLRAAEAKGNKGRRRPAIAADNTGLNARGGRHSRIIRLEVALVQLIEGRVRLIVIERALTVLDFIIWSSAAVAERAAR